MAFVHGKGSFFEIDNSSGTPVDISQYVDNVDGLPGEVEQADVTSFGDSGRKRIPGLENGQFTVSGSWDSTLDAQMFSLRGLSSTSIFTYAPAGNSSGAVAYTGECRLSSYTGPSQVGSKVTWSGSFNVDGAVDRTTL